MGYRVGYNERSLGGKFETQEPQIVLERWWKHLDRRSCGTDAILSIRAPNSAQCFSNLPITFDTASARSKEWEWRDVLTVNQRDKRVWNRVIPSRFQLTRFMIRGNHLQIMTTTRTKRSSLQTTTHPHHQWSKKIRDDSQFLHDTSETLLNPREIHGTEISPQNYANSAFCNCQRRSSVETHRDVAPIHSNDLSNDNYGYTHTVPPEKNFMRLNIRKHVMNRRHLCFPLRREWRVHCWCDIKTNTHRFWIQYLFKN